MVGFIPLAVKDAVIVPEKVKPFQITGIPRKSLLHKPLKLILKVQIEFVQLLLNQIQKGPVNRPRRLSSHSSPLR